MRRSTARSLEPRVVVRRMSSDDACQVLRINASSRPAVAALDENELARLMALPSHHLVATNADGRVVAYALAFDRHAAYDGEEFLAHRLATRERFVYIDQVAVTNASRGVGIGRSLYGALASIAEAGGTPLLCCEVNTVPPNPGSMAFHRKLGFESIGPLATADGRNVELLALTLSGGTRAAPGASVTENRDTENSDELS